MEKKGYIEWILRWFYEKVTVDTIDIKSNFFTNGLLNSFQTLELVMSIETSLQISLPDSVLVDSKFSTIDGLAAILSELNHIKNIAHVE